MQFNLVTSLDSCYQAIQSNPALLLYSHIPTVLVSMMLAFFVYFNNKKSLPARLLFSLSGAFLVWSALDLVVWNSIDSREVIFAWSFLGTFYSLLFVLALHLFYSIFDEKNIYWRRKVFLAILFLPIVILSSSRFNLSSFNVASCEATEVSLYTNYYLSFGLFVFLWILLEAILQYRRSAAREEKRRVLFFTLGIGFFLLSFSVSSYWARLVDNFKWEQYGLFGMPVFVGLLSYLIVRYRVFNVKLLGAQVLVATLVLLIGSQFFFINTFENRILTGVTLFLSVIFGYILLRSVEIEDKRKGELQEIADRLAVTNEELRRLDNAKSEFISIASHQLRTPLTAIKGYVSLILEGSYGKIDARMQDVLNKVYLANDRLVQLVENLLSISRIESGRMQYQFAPAHLEGIVHELVDMFAVNARNKHLLLELSLPDRLVPELVIDANKIRETISNLMDNAIKYTEKGTVKVSIKALNRFVRITVEDSGMGIRPEDLPHLFNKFIRGKDMDKVHVSGTGLGLYVGKNFVEAHGGFIWAESDGPGRGSRFIIELPLPKTEKVEEE